MRECVCAPACAKVCMRVSVGVMRRIKEKVFTFLNTNCQTVFKVVT